MGYVYVLSNRSMPGLLKIGSTDRSPEDRVSELSAVTGVPTPFVIEFHASLEDAQAAERQVHLRFHEHRVSGSREFFSAPLEEVVRELKQLRLAQMLAIVEAWERELHGPIVTHLIQRDPSLLERPALQPARLDAAIATLLSWDDESLMKVIDALLTKRPALRNAL